MNVYLLTHNHYYQGWTHHAAVVVAEDEATARSLHPSREAEWIDGAWRDPSTGHRPWSVGGWPEPSELKVTLLGQAEPGSKRKVVLANSSNNNSR
jgi:hypothetical protein